MFWIKISGPVVTKASDKCPHILLKTYNSFNLTELERSLEQLSVLQVLSDLTDQQVSSPALNCKEYVEILISPQLRYCFLLSQTWVKLKISQWNITSVKVKITHEKSTLSLKVWNNYQNFLASQKHKVNNKYIYML